MKQIKFLLIALFIVFYTSNASAQNKTFDVVGVYSHWVNSMCSQNCDVITIGDYSLTAPLGSVALYTNDLIVWAKGSLVEVEELPTIAGPNADRSQANIKVKKIKYKVENFKTIKFVDISISKKELENQKNNKDFKLNFTFENPLKQSISFKFKIDPFDYQTIELNSLEKKKVSYDIKASNWKQYATCYIKSTVFDDNNKETSTLKAQEEGLVINIQKKASLSDIRKEK